MNKLYINLLYIIISSTYAYPIYDILMDYNEINNNKNISYIIKDYNDNVFPIWKKKEITWTYFPNKNLTNFYLFDSDIIIEDLHATFNYWQYKLDNNITFKYIPYYNNIDIDIEILFANYTHNNKNYNCKFNRNTLAHAFKPGSGLGGDIHFNANLDWGFNYTIQHKEKYLFYISAMHEVGHSIGLSHIKNKKSIMYPYYKQDNIIYQIDINQFKFLYNISDHGLTIDEIEQLYIINGIKYKKNEYHNDTNSHINNIYKILISLNIFTNFN